MPVTINSSDTTSPAIAAGLPLSFSFSQRWARAMETIGSHEVMMARTGPSRVPCWKASWLSTKPTGATMARA